jgi:hypothetical protein
MTVVLIQVALDEALLASTAVMALVQGRIYSGLAPESAPLPYIRYGSSDAVNRNAFGGAGRQGHEEVIDIFSGRSDKLEVLEIYEAMRLALHRVPLELEDGRVVYGNLSLVGTVADPDGGMNGLVRYTPRSR